jgi:hypothetical protein
MNKLSKYFSVLIAIVFLLSACIAPAGGGTAITTATPVPLPTDLPTAIQTFTPTLPPTITPTASITPLPTIATFTPTFDVRTIVTVTPATAAECPRVQSAKTDASITFTSENVIEQVVEALNQGILFETLERNLNEYYHLLGGSVLNYSRADLTNDSVPELIIKFSPDVNFIYILGCKSNQYKILFSFPPDLERSTFEIIGDANKNGVPEILIGSETCSTTCGGEFFVLEWKLDSFQKVLETSDFYTSLDNIVAKDLDNDGLMEFSWAGGISTWNYLSPPWRLETHIYKWNGERFAALPVIFDALQFRFQAIQDADRETLAGNYDKAFQLYYDAIVDTQLGWWSPELFSQQHDIALSPKSYQVTPTPPAADATEYPRLAAYAYYRMVALHAYLGEMDAATVQYNTLQQKFPAGDPGHPYVEMATAFWDAYQSSANMTTACAAAIEYAAEHPEILIPLGSDYHGWQSHQYVPADVCPFR